MRTVETRCDEPDTSEKSHGPMFWALVAMVVTPLVYALSVVPVFKLAEIVLPDNGFVTGTPALALYSFVYAPIFWLVEKVDMIGDFYQAYFALFGITY